jgi:guanylate kinase
MSKGTLFVLSAPSGAGKSTLIDRVMPLFPKLLYSVSCTTRKPRKGEVDGVDYYFTNETKFQEMIKRGSFLEWKEVHGNLYGTLAPPVLLALARGQSMIMDIDVQGALDVFRNFSSAVGIFIAPPDMETLEQRLRSRGTDSEDAIRLRLENALAEAKLASKFYYILVNDDLETAVLNLTSIIEGNLRINKCLKQ